MSIQIEIKSLSEKAKIPQYMTAGAAGCDVTACLEVPLVIEPLQRMAVSTGLAVAIPPGFEIQVRPRSGLALKKGLTVVNAPGTVDSDYRGEVKILMINLSDKPVTVEPGERIAQWVVHRVEAVQFKSVKNLSETLRDAGGFGSTGA